MKARVIYLSDTDADIVLQDGGVVGLHHNGECMVSTYCEKRVIQEELNEDEDLWDKLSEGKQYLKHWDGQDRITNDMIIDGIGWLGYSEDSVCIRHIK